MIGDKTRVEKDRGGEREAERAFKRRRHAAGGEGDDDGAVSTKMGAAVVHTGRSLYGVLR